MAELYRFVWANLQLVSLLAGDRFVDATDEARANFGVFSELVIGAPFVERESRAAR